MKKAIIDIGSNTINLLIGSISADGKLQVIHDEKSHAKLAKGGLIDGNMTVEALERGYNAIAHFHQVCVSHNLTESDINVYATATIRNTGNGQTFTAELKKRFNLTTNIITGEEEALFIFNGVKAGYPLTDDNVLVMDIGGGSVEFIIGNKNQVVYKQSFPIGVSKMLDKFKPSDPVTIADISKMKAFFTNALQPLFEQGATYNPSVLIGSSGSFDTIKKMLVEGHSLVPDNETYTALPKAKLKKLFSTLISSSVEERKELPGMDLMRIDYMPVAAVLIATVLNNINIAQVSQCGYALKEGALFA